MKQEEVLQILEECGAMLNGHFVLKSERHSGGYVNKDAAYPNTRTIDKLCEEMAMRAQHLHQLSVVVGPAVAGTILANRVAAHLSKMIVRNVSAVYADKIGDGFVLKRGYDEIVRDKKCAVVEDIVTTGGSIKKTVEAVQACGGKVVAAVCIVNRGGVTAEAIGVPTLLSLAEIKIEAWTAKDCPLCRQGVPVNLKVGHGSDFEAKKFRVI